MIHILLLLLKIIGFTLLSILGLLVLTVLVVLFVPIRYSLNAEVNEKVKVRAGVSWLLHLLHVEAAYDGTFGIVIRLLGIPVKRIPAPEEKSCRTKKAKQKKRKRPRKETSEQALEEDDVRAKTEYSLKTENTGTGSGRGSKEAEDEQESADRTVGETVKGREYGLSEDPAKQPVVLSKTEQTAENDMEEDSAYGGSKSEQDADSGGQAGDGESPKPEGGKRKKLTFFQKIARFFRKAACFFRGVRAFFSKILYTIRNICGKIEKIRDLTGYYLEVLRSEEAQHTFALVKRETGILLRHIAPTKLKGNLTIGMDDPAATGQIIAILSMFYPVYGNNVSITPDFDEKCLRGSLDLKGRIRIITLIRIAWRVYFNKDIKKFLHMLKREENEA